MTSIDDLCARLDLCNPAAHPYQATALMAEAARAIRHLAANTLTLSDGTGHGTVSTTDACQSPGMPPTSISKDQTP